MSYAPVIPLMLLAYLLGAIPTGIIVGRFAKGVDLRDYGSGRTGATNALRALGWKLSLVVFLGDVAKGAVAVTLPRIVFQNDSFAPYAVLLCGLAVITGHIYSVFIGFKGGRGVAVGLGQMAAVSPLSAIAVLLVALPVMRSTGYVSLGSVLGCAVCPIIIALEAYVLQGTIFGLSPSYLAWSVVCSGYVIFAHRDNIQRLLNGTERKLSEKSAATVAPESAQTTQAS